MVGSSPIGGGLYFSTLISRRRMSSRSRGHPYTCVFWSQLGTWHWLYIQTKQQETKQGVRLGGEWNQWRDLTQEDMWKLPF